MGLIKLDDNIEAVLKEILDKYKTNGNKADKAVRDIKKNTNRQDRDKINRVIDYLCGCKYLSKKVQSIKLPGGSSSKSVQYDLTYNGEHYFDLIKDNQEKDNNVTNEHLRKQISKKQYDVFISHANADKLEYVNDLYNGLNKLGVKIFYDSNSLSWGDDWKKKILDGIATSEFAIIVISESFFGREWTQRELSELLEKQNESGQKIILPLLFNVTLNDLKKSYPQLESIQCIQAVDYSITDIVVLYAKELIKRFKAFK